MTSSGQSCKMQIFHEVKYASSFQTQTGEKLWNFWQALALQCKELQKSMNILFKATNHKTVAEAKVVTSCCISEPLEIVKVNWFPQELFHLLGPCLYGHIKNLLVKFHHHSSKNAGINLYKQQQMRVQSHRKKAY